MSRIVVAVCLLLGSPLMAAEPEQKQKPVNEKIIEVAGTAEFLRSVPKHFATLQAVDVANNRVTLLLEGEKLAKVWPLTPDAEVKVMGWWARLDQFTVGDRVWVWFQTDRKKQPAAVAMLADEISQQDIHGRGVTLDASADGKITVKPPKGENRTLKLAQSPDGLTVGKPVYFQSSGDKVRLILTAEAFETKRDEQKVALRKRWTDEGLPGSVTFLHRFSGEMELMLDHEAMRWGRSLQLGDKVSISADPPIAAVVKLVKPWRERTQVRLVVHGVDQADLSLGQRIRLKMPGPAAEVDSATLPPDIDRPRSKEERVEWFLSSIYCTCAVANDTCTGHFYTLASCNPNGCGMPNAVRKTIAELIEKGMTDKQIFEQLLKEQGPDLLRPHLRP
jgi:hypothetical protein